VADLATALECRALAEGTLVAQLEAHEATLSRVDERVRKRDRRERELIRAHKEALTGGPTDAAVVDEAVTAAVRAAAATEAENGRLEGALAEARAELADANTAQVELSSRAGKLMKAKFAAEKALKAAGAELELLRVGAAEAAALKARQVVAAVSPPTRLPAATSCVERLARSLLRLPFCGQLTSSPVIAWRSEWCVRCSDRSIRRRRARLRPRLHP
jgi:hypothetical protein